MMIFQGLILIAVGIIAVIFIAITLLDLWRSAPSIEDKLFVILLFLIGLLLMTGLGS